MQLNIDDHGSWMKGPSSDNCTRRLMTVRIFNQKRTMKRDYLGDKLGISLFLLRNGNLNEINE